MNTVAIIHDLDASVSVREILLACGDEYRPVFLLPPAHLGGTQFADMISRVAQVRVVDAAGWAAAAERTGARAVTTFVDRYVTVLDEVAGALGWRGGAEITNCWDKFVQRELLNKAGASSVLVAPVSSADDLRHAREAVGRAGILKPRRSSTGRGIQIVAAPDSSAEVWGGLAARSGPGPLAYLYEQLMDDAGGDGWLAPFVSVDTASVGRRRCHFGLFEKLPLLRGYIETGHLGASRLPATARARVLDAVERALDALGVADRVTHTEVRLTSAGPQVLEVNGRLGGYVQGLSASLTGADPARIAIELAAGARPLVPSLADLELADHAVGAVQVPLDTDSPALARRVARMLRAHPLVGSVQVPEPITDTLRYAGAWLESPTRGGLIGAVAAAIGDVCGEPPARDVVDPHWLQAVTHPPQRLLARQSQSGCPEAANQ